MFNRKLATLALVLGTTAIVGACSAENETVDPTQGDPAIENTDPTTTDPTMEEPMDEGVSDPAALPEDESGVPANE